MFFDEDDYRENDPNGPEGEYLLPWELPGAGQLSPEQRLIFYGDIPLSPEVEALFVDD
jgi:hypothetical protein